MCRSGKDSCKGRGEGPISPRPAIFISTVHIVHQNAQSRKGFFGRFSQVAGPFFQGKFSHCKPPLKLRSAASAASCAVINYWKQTLILWVSQLLYKAAPGSAVRALGQPQLAQGECGDGHIQGCRLCRPRWKRKRPSCQPPLSCYPLYRDDGRLSGQNHDEVLCHRHFRPGHWPFWTQAKIGQNGPVG